MSPTSPSRVWTGWPEELGGGAAGSGLAEFDLLWKEQLGDLYKLCLACTNGRDDLAEEALARSGARAVEKYLKHSATLEDPGAWLRKLTYHVCIDLHREIKRRSEKSLDQEVELSLHSGELRLQASDDPERELLRRELSQRLRLCARRLPPRLRQLWDLHIEREMSYREVADLLGITEANVRKRMQHLRQALRSCLAGN